MKWVIRGALALVILAAIAFFGVLPSYIEKGRNPVTGPLEGWPVSDAARALHQQLVIGDWHADPLLWERDLLARGTRGHIDIPRLAQGNVAVQVFSTVTKSPARQNYENNSGDTFDRITPLVIAQGRPPSTWGSLRARALDQAKRLRAMSHRGPESLRIIRSRADLANLLIDRRAGAQIVGGILGTEGGHPLEGDLANLDVLYDAGFRLIGLTHFFDNELGGSLHGESDEGLTEFGRSVVLAMIEKRMVIDLAHASPQMVRDVLAIPGARPVLSHTGVYSHCAVHRNIDDSLLQAIAAKGGVIGIGYWKEVVCGQTPGDIAGAITSAIALLGEDHVSLGSDYDGAVAAPFDASDLVVLTQALMDAGLTEAQITKVMGGNMMRYLGEALP